MSEASDNLKVLVDAEIFIDGEMTPADEQKLRDMLEQIPGVSEFSIAHRRVDVRYDPISVTKKEIAQQIEGAGYRVSEVEAAAASPIVDANLPV